MALTVFSSRKPPIAETIGSHPCGAAVRLEERVKNLVLCCDGTANEFARDRTNVVKLFSTLDHRAQHTYYHPGLGTMEAAGALTTVARRVTKGLGQAFGYGLEADIRDAYVFLMRYFEPDAQVFMFGFSRGAYTVRAVASLLKMYGLMRPGNEAMVPYAIRMLLAVDRASRKGIQTFDEGNQLADAFRVQMGCVDCKPHFVGVWDTVSSIGWVENPLKLPFVSDNDDIAIGRHAVAIDERRAFFRNHLWRPSPLLTTHGPRDCAQVWFPGVHCDVGGGYPESESALSKVPLEWMLCEAKLAGLQTVQAKEDDVLGRGADPHAVAPDPNGMMHESLQGYWRLAEYVWKKRYNWSTKRFERRMNRGRRRSIPLGACVHDAAYQRQGYTSTIPPNAKRIATRCGTPALEAVAHANCV